MKLTVRHFLGAIIAVIGLTFIFSVPITNYMITSFHPTVEHLKSKPSNIPYDWDSVRLINLFNVAQARIDPASIHVIGAIYNERIGLNTPIAEEELITRLPLYAHRPFIPMSKWEKAITSSQLIIYIPVAKPYLVLYSGMLLLGIKLTSLTLARTTRTKLFPEKLFRLKIFQP